MNSGKSAIRKVALPAAKVVSRNRSFKKISTAKMELLKQKHLKKRTFAKVQWAVRAYQEWRESRINDVMNYDLDIFESNLDDLENLREKQFENALCRFIPEVTKVKDKGEYPGKTLYEMVIALQKFLTEKGFTWKLIDGPNFSNVRVVLDNVMKERAEAHIGMVRKQAQLIPIEFEDKLWKSGILGEDQPDKLRDTVLFLIGINCGLRAGDEHYALRRDGPTKKSQFSFKRNSKGVRCLLYQEDFITKTNDNGLNSMNKERKIVCVHPSSNINRCPVRLLDKYLSLLPPVRSESSKHNFYLRSMDKFNPGQWFTTQVVGLNTLKKTVGKMSTNAGFEGFFTNHSLHRSSTTRLFQAGVEKKIIKEFTGHHSDALDKYEITSENQRENVSRIIGGEVPQLEPIAKVPEHGEIGQSELEVKVTNSQKYSDSNMSCVCTKKVVKNDETSQIHDMIQSIMSTKRGGKTKIKIEIEFSD